MHVLWQTTSVSSIQLEDDFWFLFNQSISPEITPGYAEPLGIAEASCLVRSTKIIDISKTAHFYTVINYMVQRAMCYFERNYHDCMQGYKY